MVGPRPSSSPCAGSASAATGPRLRRTQRRGPGRRRLSLGGRDDRARQHDRGNRAEGPVQPRRRARAGASTRAGRLTIVNSTVTGNFAHAAGGVYLDAATRRLPTSPWPTTPPGDDGLGGNMPSSGVQRRRHPAGSILTGGSGPARLQDCCRRRQPDQPGRQRRDRASAAPSARATGGHGPAASAPWRTTAGRPTRWPSRRQPGPRLRRPLRAARPTSAACALRRLRLGRVRDPLPRLPPTVPRPLTPAGPDGRPGRRPAGHRGSLAGTARPRHGPRARSGRRDTTPPRACASSASATPRAVAWRRWRRAGPSSRDVRPCAAPPSVRSSRRFPPAGPTAAPAPSRPRWPRRSARGEPGSWVDAALSAARDPPWPPAADRARLRPPRLAPAPSAR